MTRSPFPLCGLALSLLLIAAAWGTAGPVSWTFNWSTDTPSVAADAGGTDTVKLTTAPGATLSGPGPIGALILTAVTPDPNAEQFTNKGFTLSLGLTDNDLGLSGSLDFHGTLNGSLSGATDNTTLAFDHLTGTLDLGSHEFDATLTLPSTPGLGTVSAQVNIQDAPGGDGPPPPPPPPPPVTSPGPHNSPEPSALVLAALGLCGAGVGAWRRRRAGAAR